MLLSELTTLFDASSFVTAHAYFPDVGTPDIARSTLSVSTARLNP